MVKQKFFKGSMTERNLATAFVTETGAFARYTFYASQADKEGFFPVGVFFREAAANELRHAKTFFKHLDGGTVEVGMRVDAGVIADTVSNLTTAAREEIEEGVVLYTGFARVADEEGFAAVAERFRATAEIERHHHERFMGLLKEIQDGCLWRCDEEGTRWRCLVCGFQSSGMEPPAVCPACDHPFQHCVKVKSGG